MVAYTTGSTRIIYKCIVPLSVRLEKWLVVFRNSCKVAGWAAGARGDAGGGDKADPGDTDPEEHGVEPPQYL